RVVERLHVHRPLGRGSPGGILRVAALAALLLVTARAERLVARARQHDDADGRIPAGVAEGIGELGDGARPERIPHLGPVDGDPRDPALLLVQDVAVGHGSSALRVAPAPADRALRARTAMIDCDPLALNRVARRAGRVEKLARAVNR